MDQIKLCMLISGIIEITGTFLNIYTGLLETLFSSCVLRSTKSIILFLTDTSGLNTRSKVISLQESFMPDTSSYARWRGNITAPITDATICYRIKIFYYRPEVIVFSYINTKGDKIRTGNKIVGVSLPDNFVYII